MTEKESWHLSKAVPVTFIFALMLQASAVIWYGSQWTAAISNNSQQISELKTSQAVQSADSRAQAVQLAKIEENTRAIGERIVEMIRQQERQSERQTEK